jgi:hypothetical protein
MSTDEMQPDLSFFCGAMSGPLAAASMRDGADDRLRSIAALVQTISAEWTRDDARTDIDLDNLGRALADVQQSHPTDPNVNSAVQFYLALQGVRSGPWFTPIKPPPAPAAALPTAKLTVFDVSGTSALSVLTAGRAGSSTAQTVPAWKLATLTKPSLITIKEVPYPACVPFYTSVQAGVASLAAMIKQTTGPFAMVGTSQGAMVIAGVYDRIRDRNDELFPRNADFVQGITYGNPCRKKGSVAPHCVDPGGNGINTAGLQSSVDSRWWDFVNPGDPAACNGGGPWIVDGLTYDYRNDIGKWSAALFAEMCINFSGNLAALIWQLLGQGAPPNIFALAYSLFDTLTGVTIGPHTTYDKTTPIAGNPSTCAQLAAQQLTDIANSFP